MSAREVLADRLRELGLDELARYLPASEPLLTALSGLPLADDPVIRALCDELLGDSLVWLERGPDDLPALLEELDAWLVSQRELGVERPDLSRTRTGWLPCVAVCGADGHEALVRIRDGTWCVRLGRDDRWTGRRAEPQDLLRWSAPSAAHGTLRPE